MDDAAASCQMLDHQVPEEEVLLAIILGRQQPNVELDTAPCRRPVVVRICGRSFRCKCTSFDKAPTLKASHRSSNGNVTAARNIVQVRIVCEELPGHDLDRVPKERPVRPTPLVKHVEH